MQKRIITVSREFGSGGRTIGKKLADNLGLKYYDKELVKQISTETGFDPKFVEENGEYAQSRSMWSYFFSAQSYSGNMSGMSPSDFLWCMQRKIILEIAEREPCVIVGRCADYILKDRTDCLNVFIHAAPALRADRIVHLYGETDKAPEKRLEDKDARRRLNYKHFTGCEWGMSQNYQLSLDSGVLGVDKCVELIENVFRSEKTPEDGLE